MKEKVSSFIDENRELLLAVSKEIFDNPELGFEEFKASKLLAEKIQEAGFETKLGVANLETAIHAIHPDISEGPVVAILAEYDALPGLGHGCGHNLIAAAGLGASLALSSIKKDLPGKLVFMGTPAEEGGGGKIFMIKAGLFDEVDAAIMFHPSATKNYVGRGGLAVQEIKIEFFGKTAHASAEPEKGINALDAIIQTFNGISALRQHITSDARMHGVITNGGVKPNIVPDYASAEFYVRAQDDKYLEELLNKVENCAKGAALSSGARLEFSRIGNAYMSRNVNKTLGAAFSKNMKAIGEETHVVPHGKGLGSSDIGNVSHVVPTIHPYMGISKVEINGHSTDFAKAASSEYGNEQMLKITKALAMTAIDVFTTPELVEEMKKEFAITKR
ncbi:MAG: M20 family metallopeptidase [Candidatus Heimdallarchaeota archaeon]|nr:M20 family metallopeptidase [Candidatus Heimdallarchaeota archaeon]MCK4254734.1 M20 family metallopeptidase [Candidatus Heimdallarchaeota archaeon]